MFKPTKGKPRAKAKVAHLIVYAPDLAFRERVATLAKRQGLSVSRFCREAIAYALDHMEGTDP